MTVSCALPVWDRRLNLRSAPISYTRPSWSVAKSAPPAAPSLVTSPRMFSSFAPQSFSTAVPGRNRNNAERSPEYTTWGWEKLTRELTCGVAAAGAAPPATWT